MLDFRMGLHSMLNEVIDAEDADDEGEQKHMSDFDALKSGLLDSKDNQESESGEIVKNDDAIDYSDITELSEDCPKTPPPPVTVSSTQGNKADETNILEDLEDAIPATKVQSSTCASTKDDKELMPPPSTPVRAQPNSNQEVQGKPGSDSGMDSDTKSDKC